MMEPHTQSRNVAVDGSPSRPHEHPGPLTLCVTCGVLLVLLAATVLSASLLKGSTGTLAGLSISMLKTLLIVAVFMNVMRATSLIRLAAVAAVLWLVIAVMLIMGDYATRGWHESNDQSLQSGSDPAAYRPASKE